MYRESLRTAKENSGQNHPLYQSNWGYKADVTYSHRASNSGPIKAKVQPETTTESKVELAQVTEKTLVLDSLNVFGQDKVADKDKFQFEGGVITRKSSGAETISAKALNSSEIQSSFKALAGDDMFKRRFGACALGDRNKIKVLMITDDTLALLEGVPVDLEEFSLYFDKAVSSLFSRMITAMKLTEKDFALTSLQVKSTIQLEQLHSEILYFQPELIITLGALATTEILMSDERLKDIHGQIINVKFQDENKKTFDFPVMPLFSPKLLQTAPNMKKTAWKDMQKAMEFLNL